ncbi:MAG: bifunctional 3-(3-hydroxy-phenyl)propionate/3-hydroxycinnamic acid hydroxylase [Sphingobium sp.]
MANRHVTCDVAIVGAGPVGATLAALLGQGGLRVFIGDSSRDIYPLPRAAHFDHEIMRVFQQLGITDAIADSIIAADRYVFQNGEGVVLLDFDLSRPAETGWKGYMMHQPGIERAIRDRLAADPRVELATGLTFARHEDDGEGVTSFWTEEAGEVEVRSRFLVGCDGAWSPVREGAGLTLDDLGFDEPWLVLDVEVDPANGLPTTNMQYCNPERPTTYVIMGNSRRRFEFMLKPGETPEQMLADERIADLLKPWNTRGLRRVERKAVYRFHALVAHRWRKGRVFIAGDAAHQMPPFAGQGMCSGIRDAVALAWRLPLALDGGGHPHLLDSYQAERDPHVRAITDAAIATGRVVCTLDPQMAAGRDAEMLAAKAAGAPMPDISSPPLRIVFGLPETARAGERFIQPVAGDGAEGSLRMDDVLGQGAWLIAGRDEDAALVGAGVGVGAGAGAEHGLRILALSDPLLEPFRPALADWLAQAEAPAVLVRADRYIFGTGEADELARAYAEQVARNA